MRNATTGSVIQAIQRHVTFSLKDAIGGWADSAAAIALLAVVFISYFDHGLYAWRFWLSGGLAVAFYMGGTCVETDDIRWLRNLHMTLLALIPVLFIVLEINGWAAVLMFFILSAIVMYHLPSTNGYIWICGFGLFLLILYSTIWADIGSIFVAIGTFTGFLFIGNSARSQLEALQANAESTRLLAELQDAHQQLQEQATQAEELAASEERNRLAREVHDTLGHRLTVAAVQLEAAQKLIEREPAKAESMVGTVRTQVLEGLEELRHTVSKLRAPLAEDLSLPISLRRLANDFEQATGLSLQLTIDDTLPLLSANHRLPLYRVAQEALTNVQKHACAQHVQVEVYTTNGQLALSITDDGRGIDPDATQMGFGLRGLEERAEQVDGTLRVRPLKDGGTRVTFTVPIEQPKSE